MPVSYVLRLSPGGLLTGQLVGEVEHVESGATATFRDTAELTAWCIRTGAGTQAPLTLVLPDQADAPDDAVPLVSREP